MPPLLLGGGGGGAPPFLGGGGGGLDMKCIQIKLPAIKVAFNVLRVGQCLNLSISVRIHEPKYCV